MPEKTMLPVEVTQLFLSNVGFVILLKGDRDERSLPIFIGAAEAQAIAIYINAVEIPRPLTHDLLKNALDFLECRLMRMEVCDLKEGTFYARLILDHDGVLAKMDCRPSDGIALALRCSAPMFAARDVIEEAGRVFKPEDLGETSPENSETPAEKSAQAPGRKPTPLESLQAELHQAVKEERYEDAARLRDEIKHVENSHTEN